VPDYRKPAMVSERPMLPVRVGIRIPACSAKPVADVIVYLLERATSLTDAWRDVAGNSGTRRTEGYFILFRQMIRLTRVNDLTEGS
jgi:hypothetical protein